MSSTDTADATRIVRHLRSVAEVLDLSGRWDEATSAIERALAVAEQVDISAEPDLLIQLCGIWTAQDLAQGPMRREQKVAYFDALERKARATGDQRLLADVLYERAADLHMMYFYDGGNPDLELDLFEQSLELRAHSKDHRGTAMAQFFVGTFHHVERHDLDKSWPYFQSAMEIGESLADPQVVSYAVRHIGHIYQERGELELAGASLSRSLELRMGIHWVPGTAYALHSMVEWCSAAGDAKGAGWYLKECTSIAEAIGMPFLLRLIDSAQPLLTGGRAIAAGVLNMPSSADGGQGAQG